MPSPSFPLTKPSLATMGLGIFALAAVAFAAGTHAKTPPVFAFPEAVPLSQSEAPDSWRAQQDMIGVAAGTYPMGDDRGPRAAQPGHTVELQAFRIDSTEVTNAAFAEFLNALTFEINRDFDAGSITSADVSTPGFDMLREGRQGSSLYPLIALDDAEARIGAQSGRFVPSRGYEQHPVAETTWAGARAYCEWRGARLPTEAEWEAAARGSEGFTFPWGNERPNADRVFVSNRTGATAPVGSRPNGASPFGALDMSGSLAEWTNSLKRPYPYDATDGREDGGEPGERVTRGGDYLFDTSPTTLSAIHRTGFSNAPDRGHRHIGFRCARSDD